MKKVIFIFALVFAAGFTFAQQNDATVNQTNGSSATVTQTNNAPGSETDNLADVTADGAGTTVTIDQTNNSTQAVGTQFGNPVDGDNIAKVETAGGSSTVDITQEKRQGGAKSDVEATVTQVDGHNSATIDQIGFNDATATVDQSLGNATATIRQVTGSGKKEVEAKVTQSGKNSAMIQQGNDNLNAVVTQTNTGGATGTINTVDILQGQEDGGLNPGVQGTRANVFQNGQGNMVDLDQVREPTARRRRADFDQIGDNNSITLDQGAYSAATIRQEGNENTFTGSQGAAGNLNPTFGKPGNNDKILDALQDGHYNTITFNGQGEASNADLDQLGENNTITMSQGDNSEATFLQNGNFNLITSDQAVGSTVTVTQNGGTSATDSNVATITSSDGSVNITQNNN